MHTSAYPHSRWTNYQNNFWENDAKYFYYDHGPLARVEYGENHVQGVDYYYTIQGWIKGVNSNILAPQVDGGQDGLNTSVNSLVAKDAYGYTLGYFQGDYSPIDTGKWNTISKRFEANTVGSSLASTRYNLFNGNISHMVTTLIQPDTNYASQTILPQGTSYKYDQLNRLVEMKAFINITNNAFGTTAYNGRYNNRFTYDANGNILSQVRKKQNGTTFDSLTYRYKKDSQGRTVQNRLYHVNDTIAAGVMTDDVDNQGTFNSTINTINTVNNYSYDKIGNLVKDSTEGIATISWTVYGKMKNIIHRTGYYRMNGPDTIRPPDLEFNYDAAGNRISKTVKPRTATTVLGDTAWISTYYARDAQGNVLSVYTQKDSAAIATAYFKQTEKHIYGSSRLAIDQTSTELLGASFSTDTFTHSLGNRSYELSNHLGNVLTTISDKRIAVDTNANDTIDFYVSDIRSATDYASYGAPLEGRTWNASSYRHGFNGQEKDDEIYGPGNTNTAMYWEYDTRLAHRWNLDPKPDAFWGPYSVFYNMPLKYVDTDGDCPWLLAAAAMMLLPSIAEAPTLDYEQNAYDMEKARNDQSLAIAGIFLGPAIDKVTSVTTGVVKAAVPKLINKTSQFLLKETEKLLAKQGGEKVVREGTKGLMKDILPEEFIKSNSKGLSQKLGTKIGQGRLKGFEKSKEGVQEAIETVQKTLETATSETQPFIQKRGKQEVIDIFSQETGHTVRINAKTKEFVSLIDEATPAVKEALKNTTTPSK